MPSAPSGGAERRGALALTGVAPIASSPSRSVKPLPLSIAVPTRTCSTSPSGRVTATVTGSSLAIAPECHLLARPSTRGRAADIRKNREWSRVAERSLIRVSRRRQRRGGEWGTRRVLEGQLRETLRTPGLGWL